MIVLAISQGIFLQGKLFFTGVLAGVLVWFAYDLLRILRRILPHGTVWIAVEDVIFFFLCAMVGFEYLYPQNLGQVKGFLVLAFVAGSIGYQLLAGRFLIKAADKVIHKGKSRFRQFSQKHKKKLKEKPEIPIEK